MPSRWQDWWRQAEPDLAHAEQDARAGFFEHTCFGAEQTVKTALRALIMRRGGEPRALSLLRLLDSLRTQADVPDGLDDKAREVGKLHIPAGYPNGFSAGAPMDYHTETSAREALQHAGDLLDYCRSQIPES